MSGGEGRGAVPAQISDQADEAKDERIMSALVEIPAYGYADHLLGDYGKEAARYHEAEVAEAKGGEGIVTPGGVFGRGG